MPSRECWKVVFGQRDKVLERLVLMHTKKSNLVCGLFHEIVLQFVEHGFDEQEAIECGNGVTASLSTIKPDSVFFDWGLSETMEWVWPLVKRIADTQKRFVEGKVTKEEGDKELDVCLKTLEACTKYASRESISHPDEFTLLHSFKKEMLQKGVNLMLLRNLAKIDVKPIPPKSSGDRLLERELARLVNNVAAAVSLPPEMLMPNPDDIQIAKMPMNTTGTVTGRISSSEPNRSNTPRAMEPMAPNGEPAWIFHGTCSTCGTDVYQDTQSFTSCSREGCLASVYTGTPVTDEEEGGEEDEEPGGQWILPDPTETERIAFQMVNEQRIALIEKLQTTPMTLPEREKEEERLKLLTKTLDEFNKTLNFELSPVNKDLISKIAKYRKVAKEHEDALRAMMPYGLQASFKMPPGLQPEVHEEKKEDTWPRHLWGDGERFFGRCPRCQRVNEGDCHGWDICHHCGAEYGTDVFYVKADGSEDWALNFPFIGECGCGRVLVQSQLSESDVDWGYTECRTQYVQGCENGGDVFANDLYVHNPSSEIPPDPVPRTGGEKEGKEALSSKLHYHGMCTTCEIVKQGVETGWSYCYNELPNGDSCTNLVWLSPKDGSKDSLLVFEYLGVCDTCDLAQGYESPNLTNNRVPCCVPGCKGRVFLALNKRRLTPTELNQRLTYGEMKKWVKRVEEVEGRKTPLVLSGDPNSVRALLYEGKCNTCTTPYLSDVPETRKCMNHQSCGGWVYFRLRSYEETRPKQLATEERVLRRKSLVEKVREAQGAEKGKNETILEDPSMPMEGTCPRCSAYHQTKDSGWRYCFSKTPEAMLGCPEVVFGCPEVVFMVPKDGSKDELLLFDFLGVCDTCFLAQGYPSTELINSSMRHNCCASGCGGIVHLWHNKQKLTVVSVKKEKMSPLKEIKKAVREAEQQKKAAAETDATIKAIEEEERE